MQVLSRVLMTEKTFEMMKEAPPLLSSTNHDRA